MPEPLMPLSEPPLYILSQRKARLLVPKMIFSFILGAIFYLGIILTLSLLKLDALTQDMIRLASLIILVIVLSADTIASLRKSRQKYLFYRNHIAFRHQQIFLREIISLQPKQNFLDKIFQTYSLRLSPQFKIENIPRQILLPDYLRKLIVYSQRQG